MKLFLMIIIIRKTVTLVWFVVLGVIVLVICVWFAWWWLEHVGQEFVQIWRGFLGRWCFKQKFLWLSKNQLVLVGLWWELHVVVRCWCNLSHVSEDWCRVDMLNNKIGSESCGNLNPLNLRDGNLCVENNSSLQCCWGGMVRLCVKGLGWMFGIFISELLQQQECSLWGNRWWQCCILWGGGDWVLVVWFV